jgi:uncharacterized protein YbaP (TraB family)
VRYWLASSIAGSVAIATKRLRRPTHIGRILLALLLVSPATAQETLEEVVVTGEQPGPALWQVSKGDHSLWIVGTLTPLPGKMTWRSKQVEASVKRSGEVLANSSIRGDLKGGRFAALRLLPSIMRLRANPDGATLNQILSPDVYARWARLHRKYFGKDPADKERWRPMFAADALYDQALKRSGLSQREVVAPKIEQLAKGAKIRIRKREFRVPITDARGLIAEFAATPRDKDIACMVATLDRIEQDLPNMLARAEAWAKGDIARLRALPYASQAETCIEAALNGPRLRAMFEQQKAALEADWLGVINYLLLTHQTSVTTLSMPELLGKDGMLAKLAQRGYTITEPQ